MMRSVSVFILWKRIFICLSIAAVFGIVAIRYALVYHNEYAAFLGDVNTSVFEVSTHSDRVNANTDVIENTVVTHDDETVYTKAQKINISKFIKPINEYSAFLGDVNTSVFKVSTHAERVNANTDVIDNTVVTYDDEIVYTEAQKIHISKCIKPINETCIQRVPQCIIIGVKKCGTRELIDFMSMHPHVVIKKKPLYEINYFLKTSTSLESYRKAMPCSYSNQITVTKSPLYFEDRFAPERIYKFNKTLKMILLVREPIQRLLSAYTFTHFQSPKNYDPNALKQNLSNVAPIDNIVMDPVTGAVRESVEEVRLSTYDTAMLRYLKFFSLDQLLIIESGEMKKKPAKVLQKVEAFLGLDRVNTEDNFGYNEDKMFYCVNTKPGMACYSSRRGRVEQKELKPETRQSLEHYFKEHNENFFKIIGKRFDW